MEKLIEMYVPAPKSLATPLIVPNKILMGPGPSNFSQRVLNALSKPIIGHMHIETMKIMDEIKEGLQYMFQTKNAATMCVSASGHGGMEAALCNLIEDNDVVLIGITGLWGQRAADMAERYGADVRTVETKLGTILNYQDIEENLRHHKPRVFFIAHGDSSTGVLQSLHGLGDLCRRYNCILLVDAVASLGGTPLFMDEWQIDAIYSGSQKVLGAPPGLAPISFNERAMAKVHDRKLKPKVFYWDINLLGDCWGCFGNPRLYHHTLSPTLLYGLREALSIVCEEGLPQFIFRHIENAKLLHLALRQHLRLELYVECEAHRLPTVTAVKIPADINWKSVSDYAMEKHSVELSGGLGPTRDIVFRIGLMGENSSPEKVNLVINVLKESFKHSVAAAAAAASSSSPSIIYPFKSNSEDNISLSPLLIMQNNNNEVNSR